MPQHRKKYCYVVLNENVSDILEKILQRRRFNLLILFLVWFRVGNSIIIYVLSSEHLDDHTNHCLSLMAQCRNGLKPGKISIVRQWWPSVRMQRMGAEVLSEARSSRGGNPSGGAWSAL